MNATAVLLINPKTPFNVGSVIRACSIFGVPWLRWTGTRVTKAQRSCAGSAKPRLPREERLKDYLGVDWRVDEHALDDFIAEGLTPVCVEVREAAEMLDEFVHPPRAVYIFGPEDGSVPKGVLTVCHRFVRIRTANRTPLNLAAAVNVVLHDRYCKGGGLMRWRLRRRRDIPYPYRDGWTCHFCGDWRPDSMIGVVSRTRLLTRDVPVTENRRYCKDRRACEDAALLWREAKP